MNVSLRRTAVGILPLAIFLCAGSREAWSAIVDPSRGNTAALNGTTTALRPELAGIILADSTQPFEITNAAGDSIASGTFRQQVVRENSKKTLDFYYQVTNTSGSHSFGTVWVYGFQNGKLDMDYLSDAPASAARPRSGSVLGVGGGIASFNFEDRFAPGQASAPLFVHTHSTAFVTDEAGVAIVFANRLTGDSDLDNLQSPLLSVARPVPAAIPLPPAFFATLTILLPMAAVFVWRKRAALKNAEA